MSVQATYNNAMDSVAVTGIEVVEGDSTFDTETQAQLLAKYPDIQQDPTLADQLRYGSGKLPDLPIGVHNASVIQFTVWPARNPVTQGTWESDNIYFDPTQQFEIDAYYKDAQEDWLSYGNYPINFPTLVEQANDDARDPNDPNDPRHQSLVPTTSGHLYSLDFPGVEFNNTSNKATLMQLANFRTFVRVCIDAGGNVDGNGWLYSRGSNYVPWYSGVSAKDDGQGHFIMDQNDAAHNIIGDGNINILQP